jgi:hypothetical protein
MAVDKERTPSSRAKAASATIPQPASLTLLIQEFQERMRYRFIGGLASRAMLLVLLVEIIAFGTKNALTTYLLLGASLVITVFWTFGDIVQREAMREISEVIAQVEERAERHLQQQRAFESWDTEYIQFHYHRMYRSGRRGTQFLAMVEPAAWFLMIGLSVLTSMLTNTNALKP